MHALNNQSLRCGENRSFIQSLALMCSAVKGIIEVYMYTCTCTTTHYIKSQEGIQQLSLVSWPSNYCGASDKAYRKVNAKGEYIFPIVLTVCTVNWKVAVA